VLVGLVLERATGTPFDVLLQDRIAGKLGLELDVFTGRYRSVGYSTGGVVMGLDQLAKWARIYVDDRGATSRPWPWAIRQTTGFGIHGYCPCEGGSFTALGHMGGRTFMSVDGDGVVVILDTDGVLVGDNLSKTVAAAHELRLIAGGGRTNAWIAE
jgi:CubicO group peptidase (beta-lactamase class C family)